MAFSNQPNGINNNQLCKSNNSSLSYNLNSLVFINPKKINPRFLKPVNITNQHRHIQNNNTAKVFINPNFKKCPQKSINIEQNMRSSTIKTKNKYDSNKMNSSNFPHLSKSVSFSQNPPKIFESKNVDSSKQSVLNCSSLKKTQKIFINPKYATTPHINPKINLFSRSSVVDGNAEERSGPKIVEASSLSTQIKKSPVVKEGAIINMCKKRNINLNKLNSTQELTFKRTKHAGDGTLKPSKIFFNPKFECRLQNQNEVSIANKESLQGMSVQKNIPVYMTESPKINSKEELSIPTSSLISFSSHPTRCLEGSIIQSKSTKISRLRKQTSSTSLVAISSTKLVRKRKSSQSFDSNIKYNVTKPILLTKTKLVRSSPSKGLNSKLIKKTKLKRAVHPKSQLQLLTPDKLNKLTPDKLNKLRKRSFTTSFRNLVTVVPNSSAITKIKSQNGKSLRLIRKKFQTNESKPVTSTRSLNSIQNKKDTPRTQLRKNLLCLAHKLRQSQFPKINAIQIDKNMFHSPSQSKYVFKNSESPTKSTIRNKTQFDIPNRPKLNSCNHVDRNKYITSKYRIIKKQSRMPTNKFASSTKDITNQIKNPASSKQIERKYKLQNTISKMTHIRKKLSIVNIGGVFYHCSRTSLTKKKSSPKKVSQNQGNDLLLHIHGQKFQLENNGQILRCLDSEPRRTRIDIGGVTFIKSSSGSSLTRTNYHTARTIIVQAKQKSLSQLTWKLKKNNEPCPFFHRLGRCTGKDRGTCVRLHDPKYIAVCKKFIQGLCKDTHCCLSHKISCHNMPTCQHFLAGHCSRDPCPYPHIKVSDDSPICLDFLRGFCILGDQCMKRHLQICPSFEKGLCPRGKYCPYPHPKTKSDRQLKGKFRHLKRNAQPPRDPKLVSNLNLRYFEDASLQKEIRIELNEDVKKPEECVSGDETLPLKKRPRLGRLPSFISLNLDESCINFNSEETKF